MTPEVYKVETTFAVNEKKIVWLDQLLANQYESFNAAYANQRKELEMAIADVNAQVDAIAGEHRKTAKFEQTSYAKMHTLSPNQSLIDPRWPKETVINPYYFTPRLMDDLRVIGSNPASFLKPLEKRLADEKRVKYWFFDDNNTQVSLIPIASRLHLVVSLIASKEIFKTRYDQSVMLNKLRMDAETVLKRYLNNRRERLLMIAQFREDTMTNYRKLVAADIVSLEKKMLTWKRLERCINKYKDFQVYWSTRRSGVASKFYYDLCLQKHTQTEPDQSTQEYQGKSVDFRGAKLSKELALLILEENSLPQVINHHGVLLQHLQHLEGLSNNNDLLKSINQMESLRDRVVEYYTGGLFFALGPPKVLSRSSLKPLILFSLMFALFSSIVVSLFYGIFKGWFDEKAPLT